MAVSCMAAIAVGCYPRRYQRHLVVLALAVMYLAAVMEMNAVQQAIAVVVAMEVG